MEVGKEVPVLPPNRPPKYRQGDIVSVGFEDATSESGIRYRQVVILGSRRAYQVRSIYCLFFPYFLWYFLRVMRVVSVVFRLFPPVFLLPFALRSDPSHFGRSPSVTLTLYPFFLISHARHACRTHSNMTLSISNVGAPEDGSTRCYWLLRPRPQPHQLYRRYTLG